MVLGSSLHNPSKFLWELQSPWELPKSPWKKVLSIIVWECHRTSVKSNSRYPVTKVTSHLNLKIGLYMIHWVAVVNDVIRLLNKHLEHRYTYFKKWKLQLVHTMSTVETWNITGLSGHINRVKLYWIIVVCIHNEAMDRINGVATLTGFSYKKNV